MLANIGFSAVAESVLDLGAGRSPQQLHTEAASAHDRAGGKPKNIAAMKKMSASATYPNKGLFLLLHQRFFQTLADALLVTSGSHQDGGNFGPIFYSYGWSFKTFNPTATINGNDLLISVYCQGDADAEAGVHTHCGDIAARVSASASASPAKTSTIFYFDNGNRELWMSLAAQPFTLQWSIGRLPWPLGDAVAKLLEIFSDLTVLFIAAFGLRWKQKLTKLPDYFPGTQLSYDLAMDKQVVLDAASGALMAAGSVNFKS